MSVTLKHPAYCPGCCPGSWRRKAWGGSPTVGCAQTSAGDPSRADPTSGLATDQFAPSVYLYNPAYISAIKIAHLLHSLLVQALLPSDQRLQAIASKQPRPGK